MSGLSCLFAEMRFAQAVDADGGEDHCAKHHLHEERIDGEQHECLRDDGDDDDAEQGRPDADMPASQYGTADNGCGKGQDEPVIANGRLADLQAGYEQNAA